MTATKPAPARVGNPTLHTIAWPSTNLGIELQQRKLHLQTDLVHLHWMTDGTLSIEEIGRLPMLLVWTLHYQCAFCGPLSEPTTAQIQALPLEQLEALADALLDFTGPNDLATWLAAHTSNA